MNVDIKVTVFDINESMLKEGMERAKKLGITNEEI
jgi:ubiquinone/menaquinone biosynthesis C-methylase UbiE